ncbi:FAD-dependent oxidoreductase [Nitrosophilus alvini]|uniref:FAD-dependent oxidoreductase n=1 Tax=Nitrosophilus alvini TaxID=2714855 RepID=UPI00190DF232|nr:FAD-dependent oxidoreductase [Nitrosophilus alvini]
MRFDIIIVGSGGAGLSAALTAKSIGLKVAVLSKSYPTRSQTSMAQGGINAVIYPDDDSVQKHIEDTIKSSQGLADPSIVEYVCKKAPDAIRWLDSIGTPFSRNGERIAQRKLGGAANPRACYAQDYTGLKILQTLFDQCIKEDIAFLNEKYLLNIITKDNTAYGVTALDMRTGEVEAYFAKAVILATGGYSRIYWGFSTNSTHATADGIAAAMRAGAKISDLEFVQFHPTALKKSSILISEAARGAGGKLINQKGEHFVDELATRDEVARAIHAQIESGNDVFLDITHLGEKFIDQNLPQERKLAILYEGVDPVKEPIPVKPAAHYTMGGIDVNRKMQTNIKGLYAAGECANAKLHGANRLGGNSLLEIIVLGKEAALNAAEYSKNITHIETQKPETLENDANFIKAVYNGFTNQIDFYEKREFLGKIFYANAGVVREEMRLKGVLSAVRQIQREIPFMGIKDKSKIYNTNLIDFIEFGNMLEISEALLVSAISRNESRGAHFRSDFPKKDDEKYLAHTIVWKEDGVLCADFERIKAQNTDELIKNSDNESDFFYKDESDPFRDNCCEDID